VRFYVLMTESIRFTSILSDVALGTPDSPRPIHMLRPGTFTDMYGREHTFTADDLQGISTRYTGRRKAPVTESHDFKRAVGRLQRLWTDEAGNLYGQPAWNKHGRALLEDEVYDAFSSEVSRDDTGWYCVGGSLTNYPAVSDLQPVALSVPPIDDPIPTEADTVSSDTSLALSQEEQAMPDVAETQAPPQEQAPPVSPTPPTPPPAASPDLVAMFAQMIGDSQQHGVEQLRTMYQQHLQSQMAEMQRQAQDAAARQIAQFQAEQRITALAQHMTNPTLQRQHALPLEADRLSKFLIGLSQDQRTEATAIFERILTAGLVSFEEIGARGGDENAPDPIEQYEAAVAAKIKGGMARTTAVSAVLLEQPTLASAYQAAREKGVR
jgi:hypothetical protein